MLKNFSYCISKYGHRPRDADEGWGVSTVWMNKLKKNNLSMFKLTKTYSLVYNSLLNSHLILAITSEGLIEILRCVYWWIIIYNNNSKLIIVVATFGKKITETK